MLVADPPQGDDWLHEIKLDGYRMFCLIDGGEVRFVSRNDQDWTARFPTLRKAAKELSAHQAVLDGEVVVLDDRERAGFNSYRMPWVAMHARPSCVISSSICCT